MATIECEVTPRCVYRPEDRDEVPVTYQFRIKGNRDPFKVFVLPGVGGDGSGTETGQELTDPGTFPAAYFEELGGEAVFFFPWKVKKNTAARVFFYALRLPGNVVGVCAVAVVGFTFKGVVSGAGIVPLPRNGFGWKRGAAEDRSYATVRLQSVLVTAAERLAYEGARKTRNEFNGRRA